MWNDHVGALYIIMMKSTKSIKIVLSLPFSSLFALSGCFKFYIMSLVIGWWMSNISQRTNDSIKATIYTCLNPSALYHGLRHRRSWVRALSWFSYVRVGMIRDILIQVSQLFLWMSIYLYVRSPILALHALFKVQFSYLVHVYIFLPSTTLRWHQLWPPCDLDPLTPVDVGDKPSVFIQFYLFVNEICQLL